MWVLRLLYTDSRDGSSGVKGAYSLFEITPNRWRLTILRELVAAGQLIRSVPELDGDDDTRVIETCRMRYSLCEKSRSRQPLSMSFVGLVY